MGALGKTVVMKVRCASCWCPVPCTPTPLPPTTTTHHNHPPQPPPPTTHHPWTTEKKKTATWRLRLDRGFFFCWGGFVGFWFLGVVGFGWGGGGGEGLWLGHGRGTCGLYGTFFPLQDASFASRVFIDFALPSIEPVLKRVPSKRHPMLRIMYSFAGATPDAHVQVRTGCMVFRWFHGVCAGVGSGRGIW